MKNLILFTILIIILTGCVPDGTVISNYTTNTPRFVVKEANITAFTEQGNVYIHVITDTQGSNDFICVSTGSGTSLQPISRPSLKVEDDGKKK